MTRPLFGEIYWCDFIGRGSPIGLKHYEPLQRERFEFDATL